MNLKLEGRRGGLVHTLEAAIEEGEPPETIIWNRRVFRFARTDGVWDQKKHVYREATVFDAGESATEESAESACADAHEPEDTRSVSLNLSPPQAALLQRVRDRGGYANNKAALLAGLKLLDSAGVMNNEALLALLAKRLRANVH